MLDMGDMVTPCAGFTMQHAYGTHLRNFSPMTQRKTQLDSLAYTLLLACCLFWGFQQVLIKATVPEVPPVFQAALRFAGATLLLWLWCRWRKVPLLPRDGTLGPGLLAGALFAIEFACIYVGLQYTGASRLTVFLYTSPFWVAALLPFFVASERLRPVQWLGLTCAFAAVVFAFGDGLRGSSAPWWGDALALAAGMFWGLTTVVIRSSSLARTSAEQLLFYQIAFSALALPLLSIALGERWHFAWTGFAVTSLSVQTVVASYLTWMWLLGRYPAGKLSAFVFLTPVFALLFGALWLHEPVTPGLLLALALVGVGIVLVNKK
jgi:drug/metabolite transporter (DMT)-like permease